MTASEILQSKVTLQGLNVLEHPYDSRFTFLELKDDTGTQFKMFYYIFDSQEETMYYGSYEIPDGVNVERIRRGLEVSI